eukprot:3171504-Rhodomonas_salina.3
MVLRKVRTDTANAAGLHPLDHDPRGIISLLPHGTTPHYPPATHLVLTEWLCCYARSRTTSSAGTLETAICYILPVLPAVFDTDVAYGNG